MDQYTSKYLPLPDHVKLSIKKCVLCWLATASKEGVPNVSPKEIFTFTDENQVLIADIASPQSIANIKSNPNVCISFIDILVQKGFQLKGEGFIIGKDDAMFSELIKPLNSMTQNRFTIQNIIVVNISFIKPVIAPSYLFYKDTQEKDQIESARKLYGL